MTWCQNINWLIIVSHCSTSTSEFLRIIYITRNIKKNLNFIFTEKELLLENNGQLSLSKTDDFLKKLVSENWDVFGRAPVLCSQIYEPPKF